MSSSMKLSDYVGFSAMTLLLIGGLNWLVVAIRYFAGAIPDLVIKPITENGNTYCNATGVDAYKHAPTPDLLELIAGDRATDVQMFVFTVVGASALVYFGLFLWMSVERAQQE